MEEHAMLYHGSPVPGLRELQPSVTKYFGKPRQVCLTASLPMALMYGAKHFEYTYGYTKDRQIYYEEYFPNGPRGDLWRQICQLVPLFAPWGYGDHPHPQ